MIIAHMVEKAIANRDASEERARRRALRHVLNGHIEWRDRIGESRHASGGFTGVGGAPLNSDLEALIALWKLRRDGLISLTGQKVKVTVSGLRQLAAWEIGGGRRG